MAAVRECVLLLFLFIFFTYFGCWCFESVIDHAPMERKLVTGSQSSLSTPPPLRPMLSAVMFLRC